MLTTVASDLNNQARRRGADTVIVLLPLICIDVDGTLVGSQHEPTEVVWQAAAAALARGQHLALSTGRGVLGQTGELAKRLDPDGWHVFHNGAAIMQSASDETRSINLAASVIEQGATVAERTGWVLEYYSAADYTVDSASELAVGHAALLGVPHVVREPKSLDGEILRLQFVVPVEATDQVAAEMATDEAIIMPATSPGMPGVAFISCTSPLASKGQAIARIAAEMGISIDDVMMVGDGHNDVEALGAVGHGVAMGNAVDEAKAAADYVVDHVDADGLAQALELSATLG